MDRFEFHNNGSVVASPSLQELYDLAKYSVGDWQVYKVFSSKLNPVSYTIGGEPIDGRDAEKIAKELKRGYSVETVRKKFKMSRHEIDKFLK